MSKVLKFDRIPSRVTTRVIKVTGIAEPQVDSINAGLTFTSLTKIQFVAGRFSAVLELTPGRNQFVFQPYAVGGTPLQSEIEVITYEKNIVEAYHAENSLDLHGSELGYERLPEERNVSFRKRLLQGSKGREDVRKHVPIAFSTEIGFPFSREMVRISPQRTTYNRPSLTNGYTKITPTALKYTGSQLVVSEGPVVFDDGYPYVTPASEVSPFGTIRLFREGGEAVSTRDYEYQEDRNRIWLKNDELTDTDLLLVYNTVTTVTLTGTTLAALKTTVEAQNLLNVDITDTEFHTSTTTAEWLIPQDWTLISSQEDYPSGALRDNPGVYLSISEIKSYPLHEHSRDLLVNGSGLGTKLERYVGEVNKVDHRTWDRIVVGRDGLRDENVNPLHDAFPHLTDAKRGHWGLNKYNIHKVQYLGTGVRDPNHPFVGIVPGWWQSGTGSVGDLESDFPVQEFSDPADIIDVVEEESNILYGIL